MKRKVENNFNWVKEREKKRKELDKNREKRAIDERGRN